MSVTQVPIRPIAKGSLVKFWLALAVLVAAAFLLARAGVPKGVEVETLADGSGAPIALKDGVLIEYKGTTDDGTVFDTTEGRGPAPLLVEGVVPGFKQALLQMKEGGRYKIRIPGRLGYGETPPPGAPFGPNADLNFEVSVVKIVRDAALQVAAAQAAQAQQAQGELPPGAAPPR